MANILFGTPNYADTSTSFTPIFSGGSWQSALPIGNVQDRRLAKVARSTNAATGSTTFDADLAVARDVELLAALLPNITKTSAATIRWIGATASSFASATIVYDSTHVAAWPASVTADTVDGANIWTVTVPSGAQTARYWRCQITDTGNADGYVEVARVVIAAAYQPAINADYGLTLGLESDSVRTVTDGGAALYREKSVRRTLTGVLANVTEAEAMGEWWQLQRRGRGVSQVFVMWDSADTTYQHERSFLGVLRQPSALEQPYLARFRTAFEVVEEL